VKPSIREPCFCPTVAYVTPVQLQEAGSSVSNPSPPASLLFMMLYPLSRSARATINFVIWRSEKEMGTLAKTGGRHGTARACDFLEWEHGC
jgi:hypothetical protein